MLSVTHRAALARCMLFELESLRNFPVESPKELISLGLLEGAARAKFVVSALVADDLTDGDLASIAQEVYNHLHKVAVRFEPEAAEALKQEMYDRFGLKPTWKPVKYSFAVQAERDKRLEFYNEIFKR